MQKDPKTLFDVKIIELAPSKIAQRCPVCNGWGSVAHGTKVCASCEGKGYILVPAQEVNRYTLPSNPKPEFGNGG